MSLLFALTLIVLPFLVIVLDFCYAPRVTAMLAEWEAKRGGGRLVSPSS